MEGLPKAYQGKENYVFISYAHKDKYRVFPAIEAMQKAGYNVWYDEGIEAGTEWPAYIADKLKGASLVFAFISKNSIGSENCTEEIYFARANKKKLLIIYLEEVTLPSGLEMRLSLMQALFAYKHSNSKSFLSELVTSKIVNETLGTSIQKAIPVQPVALSKEEEEKKKFNEAVQLWKVNNMKEAVEKFMAIGTHDAQWYVYTIAYKYFQNKEYDNALKVLARIKNFIKDGTCNAKELIEKCKQAKLKIERDKAFAQAQVLQTRKDYEAALEKYFPLIKYEPSAASQICNIANEYYSKRMYDQALALYCRLMRAAWSVEFYGKEKVRERLYSKAQAYKEKWKNDKSEETLEKAAEYYGLSRGYKDASYEQEEIIDKLALSAYKKGDFEKAIEYFVSISYTKNKEKYMERLTKNKGYEYDCSWEGIVGVTQRKKVHVLPEHVRKIWKDAFNQDEVITEITGNSKLEHIQRESFEWCDSLEKVDLSKTKIKRLEGCTFAYCKKLTTLIMPKEGNPTLESEYVFHECDNLKTIITSSGKKMPLDDYILTYLE